MLIRWPLAVGVVLSVLAAAHVTADTPRVRIARIVYLGNSSPELETEGVSAFRHGLRDLGYVEGQSLVIDYRWAEGRYDRLPALVANAVHLKPDLFVASGTPAVLAAMGDPVGAGVVASLARPGGNVTGSASMTPEIDGKRLELLKELAPTVTRIAVLWNPANPGNAARLTQIQDAARTLRLSLEPIVGAADVDQIDRSFSAIATAKSEALIVESDRALLAHRVRIVDLAIRRRLPGLYPHRDFVHAGGLASYEPNYPAMFRRAATYVDKILKGARPADLPVEQPTKFDFVVNLKTAKALGLTLSQSVLLRADQVIQ
jgi:putative ABC transport system substrate-binding protein